MARGFKSGGRQAGTPNKDKAKEREEAAAGGDLPLAYMLKVMRNKKAEPHRRDDMAKAAAPYLHAKLTGDTGMHVNVTGEYATNGNGHDKSAEVSGIRVEFVAPRKQPDDVA